MKDPYKNYLLLAQEALVQNNQDQALKAFTRALAHAKKLEDRVASHYSLADIYWAKGQTQEAKDHYRQVLRLAPDEAGACYGLAILSKDESPKKAIYWFKKAILRNPSYAQAYYYQAHVLNDLGRREEARELFLQASNLDPQDPLALNDLGSLYEEEGEDDLARDYFSRAIQVHPSFARALYNMGVVEYKLGRPEEALAYYRRALEETEEVAAIYLNMSAIYLETQRPQEALEVLDQGLKRAGDDINLYYNRACAQMRLGCEEEAREDLARAIDLEPDAFFWAKDDEDLKDLVLERNEDWL